MSVAIKDMEGDGDNDVVVVNTNGSDGGFTVFDFLAFQNAFDAGCP